MALSLIALQAPTGTTTQPDDGRALAGGDYNADGISDLVIGGPSANGIGRVTLVYGSASFGGATGAVDLGILDLAFGATLTGAGADGRFGAGLAGGADLNGDGRDDLVVTSPGAGIVTVYHGGAGFAAPAFVVSGLPQDATAITVAMIGDLNGDGLADFAIGVPDAAGASGAVHVIFGAASGANLDVGADLTGSNGFSVFGVDAGDGIGAALAAGGDLNGDGIDDLVIGAPGVDSADDQTANTGAVYVVFGRDGGGFAASLPLAGLVPGSPSDATAIILQGVIANGAAGAALAGAPTGLLIGAPGADVVLSLAGDTLTASRDLAVPGTGVQARPGPDGFGSEVVALGDISGDGSTDIGILSANGDLSIVLGDAFPADGPGLPIVAGAHVLTVSGFAPGTATLAAVGDVTGDGIADFAVSVIETTGLTRLFAGGLQNLVTLDAADGVRDGTVSLAALTSIPGAARTSPDYLITGETLRSLTEDTPAVSGTISVVDLDGDSANDPDFADARVTGAYGVFLINAAGTGWTYTLDPDAQMASNFDINTLSAGAFAEDRALITGGLASLELVARITGVDDAARVSGQAASIAANQRSVAGQVVLFDPDDPDPTVPVGVLPGTHGRLDLQEDGRFDYVLTDPDLAAGLGAGNSRQDVFDVTASDGTQADITITITGVAPGITTTGTAGADRLLMGYGADRVNAGDGSDTLDGAAGSDTLAGENGHDMITDPLGNDVVDGGPGHDNILLLSGNNDVLGDAGSDLIRTGYGADRVAGGAGNDLIDADFGAGLQFGNDTLDGGAGNDLLRGGAGADVFVFRPSEGTDIIGRFSVGSDSADPATGFSGTVIGADFEVGIDTIRLLGFGGLDATNVLSQIGSGGGNAEFSAAGTTIIFFGVQASQLTADDFAFL